MESDSRFELRRLAEWLFRSVDSIRKTDWFSGRDITNIMLKGFADPSVMYGRLMATSVVFWLRPDDARSGKAQPSPSAEHTFNLLWIAYEQWLTRGLVHYSEVMALMERFYRQLRWILIHNRHDRKFHAELDAELLDFAKKYLENVRNLADKNFDSYVVDIENILKQLKPLTPRDSPVNEEQRKGEQQNEEEQKKDRQEEKPEGQQEEKQQQERAKEEQEKSETSKRGKGKKRTSKKVTEKRAARQHE